MLSWSELHGAITHFPLALLMVSVAFDIGALALRKREWGTVGYWLLAVGAVSALPAALVGIMTARSLFPGGWPPITKQHFAFALGTVVLSWAALIMRTMRSDLHAGRTGLVLGVLVAAMVGRVGYLGGRMVFAEDQPAAPAAAAPVTPASPAATDSRLVSLGDRLFHSSSTGCTSCHRMDGKGGMRGPDLTHEAARHADVAWHIRHLKAPDAVHPGSAMPPYDRLTPAELEALSHFLATRR
ncbi:MAG TPA: DUF2231 domain-containing protein [Armatimonadota bacterium]|jgi:mono/diheme cytochrome c family protein